MYGCWFAIKMISTALPTREDFCCVFAHLQLSHLKLYFLRFIKILIIPLEHLKDTSEPAAVRYYQIKYIAVMLQTNLPHQYHGQFLN